MKANLMSLLLSIIILMAIHLDSVAQELSDINKANMVKRGEEIVLQWGCNTCHSPKIYTPHGQMADPDRLLSGHPEDSAHPEIPYELIGTDKWGGFFTPDLTSWAGPWGVSFAANLTPDKDTGIGKWTEDEFLITIKTGRKGGTGRNILPPMPVHELARLSDDELKSIFAYLISLKPIHNKVPDFISGKDQKKDSE